MTEFVLPMIRSMPTMINPATVAIALHGKWREKGGRSQTEDSTEGLKRDLTGGLTRNPDTPPPGKDEK